MATKYLDSNGLTYLLSALRPSTAPADLGTAAAGLSKQFAKADHVHKKPTASDVGAAASSHTHGNIQNGGTLQTNDIAIANGDKLVVTDSSDSSKVARTSVSFDASTTTKALTQKGTFETFATSDTQNTAGSTDSSSKLFIIGATSQTTSSQTYSQDTAYVGTDGHLYSDSKQVVNLSGTQTLTNKTLTSPTITGASLGSSTATTQTAGDSSTYVATTAFVATAISNALVGGATFKGTVNTGTDISGLTAYTKGWYWVVGTAGTYVGETCEAGDMIFCISNFNSAYSASDFDVIQTNLDITSITNLEIDAIIAA